MTVNAPAPRAADRVCLALDLHDEDAILRCVDELGDLVGCFKLNSAFTLFGPQLVKKILARGAKVFLDLKFHDIPHTLAGYGEAVTRLGAHIVTVHTAGGSAMLGELIKGAERTAAERGLQRPRFMGITVLTSISRKILNDEMNVPGTVPDEVLRKARLAAQSGLDGLVCSAAELDHIRPHLPPDFYYVTPGVRPAGGSHDDHQRAYSYAEAIRAGASLLVVGRAVLGAASPRAALEELHAQLAG